MKVNYPYFESVFERDSGVTDLLIYLLKNRQIDKANELAEYIKEKENKEEDYNGVYPKDEFRFYRIFENPSRKDIDSKGRPMNLYFRYLQNPPVVKTSELENLLADDLLDDFKEKQDKKIASLPFSMGFIQYFGIQSNDKLAVSFKSKYENFQNKLVDDDGIPIVFYHGVRNFHPNFRSEAMGNGVKIPFGNFNPQSFPATYFSPDLEYVMFYAGIAPNMPKPTLDYFGYIYPVMIKMVNP